MLEGCCCSDAEEAGPESILDMPPTNEPHHAVFVVAL
jgi:hypothetical protein